MKKKLWLGLFFILLWWLSFTFAIPGPLLLGTCAGSQSEPAQAAVGQDDARGQGVRLRNARGELVSLYDESHALVIGVSQYANGWPKLPGVVSDLIEIHTVLRKQGFQIRLCIDPTSATLNNELRDFISDYGQKERNRLLIYFAGHGYTEERADGRDLGYLVPADAPLPERNPALFNRRALQMEEIVSLAAKINSKHALFIFDSCFSGSIFEARNGPHFAMSIESSAAGPVRQFITAGAKNQTVPDQSIFRRYFVRAFEQGEGDLNLDGYITGEELGVYLQGRVAKDSFDAQTPRYGKINNAYLNIGDFIFALPKAAGLPATGKLLDAEDAHWDSARQNSSLPALESYLAVYCPTGRYCQAAWGKLRELRSIPTSAPVASVTTERRAAWEHQRRGDELTNNGDVAGALAELSQAIRLDPAYADAYHSRGHAYSQSGNLPRAIEDYTTALRLNPRHKNAFFGRGYAYFESQRYEQAIADYTQALLLDPSDYLLFTNRGAAYTNKGAYNKAIADFGEALKLNPRYVIALRYRASVYRAMGKDELARNDESAARKLANQLGQ